jgi:hypothetical protein
MQGETVFLVKQNRASTEEEGGHGLSENSGRAATLKRSTSMDGTLEVKTDHPLRPSQEVEPPGSVHICVVCPKNRLPRLELRPE